MQRRVWYQRYAWVVFVLVGLAGLIPGLIMVFAPLKAQAFVKNFGHPLPAMILADAEGRAFMEFFFRWVGTVLIGGNVLTLFIAVTAFRKGQPWAWLAFWYWPLMFTAHLLMYASGSKISQVVWLVLTAVALLVTYPMTRRTRSEVRT